MTATLPDIPSKSPIKNPALWASIISALIIVGICSKSSPIYPLNDWVDSNCFLTVGKSMWRGIVPYRDLFEQKGPLLYFLHAAAALISRTTFLGVFFLEVAAAAAFLFVSRKIMLLYAKGAGLFWIPVIAAFTYSTPAFKFGDSAEELCLPAISLAIYLGLKAIKFYRLPTNRDFFLIGLSSGAVLWTKFSLLGVYLGWFITFFVVAVRRRNIMELFKKVMLIILGIAIVSLPVLLYFAINNSISHLFEVYFYNNLFLYTTAEPASSGIAAILFNLWNGAYSTFWNNPPLWFFFVAGFYAFRFRRRRPELLFYVLTFSTMFLLVFVGGRRYAYYSLILSSFLPIGMIALCRINSKFAHSLKREKKLSRKHIHLAKAVIPVVCIVISFIASGNTYLLNYKKQDMPQYQFAEIINRKENPTLLNYGFLDGGFYTAADIYPSCRYFVELNIPYEPMYEGQEKAIADGTVDFVVTEGDKPEKFDGYALVASSQFFSEGKMRHYYLYEKGEV